MVVEWRASFVVLHTTYRNLRSCVLVASVFAFVQVANMRSLVRTSTRKQKQRLSLSSQGSLINGLTCLPYNQTSLAASYVLLCSNHIWSRLVQQAFVDSRAHESAVTVALKWPINKLRDILHTTINTGRALNHLKQYTGASPPWRYSGSV